MHKLQEFYKNRNVLVTGGAGFIGSHLCEQLVALGAHVRVLDNLSTSSGKNLDAIRENIEFIQGSVTDFVTCVKATETIDTVFHLAAVVSVAESQKNPSLCLETNITGTQNIIEAARQTPARLAQTRRVILASSAAVYGNYDGVCEEQVTPNPVSTYGYSKLLGEELCQLYAKVYALETVCLRYFNVYGPRQNPDAGNGGVLAVLNHKLAQNQPLVIFGDGNQTRDFIHVSQIVQANLQAGTLDKQHAYGNVFNIATGTSVSLNSKLHELLKQYPDYKEPITYMPARSGDIMHSWADCSKFKNAVI